MKNQLHPRAALMAVCLAVLMILLGASVSRAVPLIGLTHDNKLVFFDSSAPQRITRRIPISRVIGGDSFMGIDVRPSTGELYALTLQGVLYRIDQATGRAVAVGPKAFTLFANEIYGLGMDFDPVADQLRVTTGSGRNFRMNPDTGLVIAFDTKLEFAPGDPNTGTVGVNDVAYSNNSAGANTTTLYGIRGGLSLVRIGSPEGSPVSPDTGQLFTVGPLGISVRDRGFFTFAYGFDIAPGENTAFMVSYSSDVPLTTEQNLYSINLATGAATFLGGIGANSSREFIYGMTVARVSNSVPVVALTKTNKLLRFQSATPGLINETLPITGLPAGESLIALDLRPTTGQLYALSDAARLYLINIATGAAFAAAIPVGPASLFAYDSASGYGLDFNPVSDELRVVAGGTGDNLRLAPDTGTLAARDPNLAYVSGDPHEGQSPRVTGAAHTTELADTPAATTLYGIDSARDTLVRQGSVSGTPHLPDTGQLNTVGALGFDANDPIGFDIDASDNTAYAVFNLANAPSRQSLYTVNLVTGAAQLVGLINTTEEVRGLAVGTRTLLRFSPSSYRVSEAAGSVEITVTRSGDTSLGSLVEYDTVSDTAFERTDYNPLHGTLRFAAGETTKTFTVFINDDAFPEATESFTLTFNNAMGEMASTIPATVTITDNDAAPPTSNPIDDIEFFVRQHYRDFLQREGEPNGFDAWVNVLRQCPNIYNDSACDRVTVSSSFFRSVEFQSKGYFVYRFYKVGLFGQRPTYEEFLRDVQRLDGQTTQEIAAQKAAFAAEWVQRPAFRERYGESSSARIFLNGLVLLNNLQLSSVEQNNLVLDLDAGRKTRADVVRFIVEHPQVIRDEFNGAFVTMQYFGYLQRDPDGNGYNAWLRYLTNNPGDFRTMVNGFVNSIEYRARFGAP